MTEIMYSEIFNGKKVLITGHTGFIGSWLTKWLDMIGAETCGCSIGPPTTPNMFDELNIIDHIKDVRVDVRDRKALCEAVSEFQPEVVFHLAAQPLVLPSYDNPIETFDTNILGTVNLLDCLRTIRSVKAIIVLTSDKSYQNKEWIYPYREIDVLGGADPYSASKSCQDVVVNSFRESYFSTLGIGISSVRAGNVIGGGDWADYRIVPDIVRGIINNETINIRNPGSVRPWQHVLEPISGMLTLTKKMLENIRYSGSWNFGPLPQRQITVEELVEKVINYWGRGAYKVLNDANYREANYLQVDISKACKELNWFPIFDIDKCIKKTVEWYRAFYSKPSADLTSEQIADYSKEVMNGSQRT